MPGRLKSGDGGGGEPKPEKVIIVRPDEAEPVGLRVEVKGLWTARELNMAWRLIIREKNRIRRGG